MPGHYSRILDQLNTLTLEAGSDARALDIVSNNVHIESKNLQTLMDLVLVNEAIMRDGNPIPGTGQVKKTLVSADSTGHFTVFQPNKGEVWLVSTISVKPTASGNLNLAMSIEDATSGERALLDADTGTVSAGTIIDMKNGPVYISNDAFLSSYVGTNTGGVSFFVACHRVR